MRFVLSGLALGLVMAACTSDGSGADGGETTAAPAVATTHAPRTASTGADVEPTCSVFPTDNPWNTDITGLSVHPRSDAYIAAIGTDGTLHPDFGTEYEGGPIGIPYVVVPGDQPKVPARFNYAEESDPGPYPIPPDAPIEGGPDSDGDRHVIVLDEDSGRSRRSPGQDTIDPDSIIAAEVFVDRAALERRALLPEVQS